MMNAYRTRDYRTARSLNEAFGPYSKLDAKPEYGVSAWAWVVGYGLVIALIWYVAVLLRA